MARTLKTYVTSVGFFDLAVAAPSMKAALDAWGFRHNAFQQGFASQTNDARIIAAATARPGIVLRRPVGTSQPFQEDAGLPEDFAIPKIGKAEKAVPKPAPAPRPKARTPVRKGEGKAESAAIISFEKEKARRDHQRAQEDVRTKRARAKRQHAIDQAQSGLEKARLQHERKLEKLERERALLERRIQKEQESWQARRGSLESALDRAHKQ